MSKPKNKFQLTVTMSVPHWMSKRMLKQHLRELINDQELWEHIDPPAGEYGEYNDTFLARRIDG